MVLGRGARLRYLDRDAIEELHRYFPTADPRCSRLELASVFRCCDAAPVKRASRSPRYQQGVQRTLAGFRLSATVILGTGSAARPRAQS